MSLRASNKATEKQIEFLKDNDIDVTEYGYDFATLTVEQASDVIDQTTTDIGDMGW